MRNVDPQDRSWRWFLYQHPEGNSDYSDYPSYGEDRSLQPETERTYLLARRSRAGQYRRRLRRMSRRRKENA